MTDDRTTELMKLLDERGEHYVHDGNCVTWSYYSDPHTATESMDGTLIVTGLTPEQAIAATLGSGALTADDVLNAVYKHGARWQAIADELNSRAERPCSMTRADRLLAELNNDRRINKQLKMANALLRKSEAAKIERIEELEELARDLHADLMEYGCTPNAHRANYKPRFEALGIEVDE